ncbi:MAG TPA: class I SAM-dependent methyltransferase [Caldisericia bacterium]|nr:MAG: putative methyltransferase [bacterium ADurb.Bin132]HNY60941.1 class I SAM-dependent methyltransferase [Caldisericia bacterium]HOC78873.1 class I SAM-dependent methyltransferase [Caldisericia bacterium]HOG69660.1 class I SAM-dependent methyltransferase [Caldisericia bacterium]HPA65694.1 class I SAM-dependent methyltransferase [Caldisericia bacterium]
MTEQPDRQILFDEWSARYDNCTESNEFPFIDFRDVLFSVLNHSDINENCSVLELGIGTGMLATMYADIAKDITGVDFSPKMVERCKTNVPEARIFQADVTKPFDFLDEQKFDRVVSNYLFHEFCDEAKLQIIERCFGDHIKEAGFMVIGDISFEDRTGLDECRNRNLDLWDDDEFYWDIDTPYGPAPKTCEYPILIAITGFLIFFTLECPALLLCQFNHIKTWNAVCCTYLRYFLLRVLVLFRNHGNLIFHRGGNDKSITG